MGHLPKNHEAAVHHYHSPSIYHWLSCIVSLSVYAISWKWYGRCGSKGQKVHLRTIFGAYKATPVPSLWVELGISPKPLHLDRRQAKVRLRSAETEMDRGVVGALWRLVIFPAALEHALNTLWCPDTGWLWVIIALLLLLHQIRHFLLPLSFSSPSN
jgi:hypothetical protein